MADEKNQQQKQGNGKAVPAIKGALSLAQQVHTIEDYLDENRKKITKALGKWMTMDRMLMLVVNSIRRNPDLGKCSPISIYSCVMQSAQLRLPPDDMRGLAYLVPFWNGKKGVFEAQFMPGFKGLVKLAKDSGEVKNVYSRVVYSNEHFEIEEGLNPRLEHVPLPPAERGNPKGTYTVTELKDGSKEFTFLWEDDIQKLRSRSKAGGSGPWVTDPDEMRKKSTIRRAMKLRDLGSERLSKAVALDEMIDTDVSSREEFEDNDFMTETLSGKPPVAQPQEKAIAQPQEPMEAEYSEQPESESARQEADFSSQVFDMIQEMGWNADSILRKNTNDIMVKNGIKAALEYVTMEYEKWLKSKETKPATTAGNGKEKKSDSLL